MKNKANNGQNTQNDKEVTQIRTCSLTDADTIAMIKKCRKKGINAIPKWSSKEGCYIITMEKF